MKITLSVLFMSILVAPGEHIAPSQSFTKTNVGGWELTLSVTSNRFQVGTPVAARLVISNTTSKRGEFGWIDVLGDVSSPSFGDVCVTNLGRSVQLPHEFKFPTTCIGVPLGLRGGQYGGSLLPSGKEVFDYDLARYWNVTNVGIYRVSFGGKLSSILEPGKKTTFETEPLIIVLEERTR